MSEKPQKDNSEKSVYTYHSSTEIECLKCTRNNTQKRSYAGAYSSITKVGKREQQNSTNNSAVCDCSNAVHNEHRTKGSASIRTDKQPRVGAYGYVKSVTFKTAKRSRKRVSELVRGNQRKNRGIRTLNLTSVSRFSIKIYSTENQTNICATQSNNSVQYSNIHSIKLTEFSQLLKSGQLCISGLECALLFGCFNSLFSQFSQS